MNQKTKKPDQEYDPHIVVHKVLETWHVEEFSYKDDAREVFNELVDLVDMVILAKRVRKHVGRHEQTVSDDDRGKFPQQLIDPDLAKQVRDKVEEITGRGS